MKPAHPSTLVLTVVKGAWARYRLHFLFYPDPAPIASRLGHSIMVTRAAVEGSFAFSFVEGILVKAIREGKWVLLDEINLASAETLQRLSGLLEV